MTASACTVGSLLADARAAGVDRLDAQMLLAHRLGRTRAWLLAHEDDGVPSQVAARVRADLAERARGVPAAYLVGMREFYGLALQVDRSVLVPRPETETLVDWALEILSDGAAEVVDLGTGSGAIALAVKSQRSSACVTATDASAAALEVARANARAHRLAIEFVRGDWWEPLAGQRFDLALCNPPYVNSGDPHLTTLHAEPLDALAACADGLGALRAVVARAGGHLRADAWLLLEHGHDQGEAVRSLLRHNEFSDVRTRRDLAGCERVTGGRWAGRASRSQA